LLRWAERARLAHPVDRLVAQQRVRLRAWHPALEDRELWHYPAVGCGEGFTQVGRGLERVPEQRQPPAGAQRLRRLGCAGDRVHPVPGLPGHDRVEGPAGRVPGFERRHLDLEPGLPGQFGHPRVGIDPEHAAAGRLEQPGGDAGAAADVEDIAAGAGGDDPVHQGVGIAGAGPVIAFGVRAERFGYIALVMRLGPGTIRRRCRGHTPTLAGTRRAKTVTVEVSPVPACRRPSARERSDA
jgi:hypothetical protein